MAISAKTRDRISKYLKKYQTIVNKAFTADCNESDTVTIISDIFCNIFGFDKYENLTSEFAIRKTFCDLAIKISEKVPLLIECKAVGIELKDDHIRQATNYAADSGIEWVVLTNARNWKVYRVFFTQPIEKQLVYEFDFTSLSLRNADTITILFPLCIESFQKGIANGLNELYDQKQVFNRFVVGNIVCSEDVVSAIKKKLKKLFPETRIETADLANMLIKEIIKREIFEEDKSADAQKMIKKAERKLAAKAKKKEE